MTKYRGEWANPDVQYAGDELTPENINEHTEMRLPHNGAMSNWIAAQFEDDYQGWAVDVGASDGRFINSTWGLEKELRWTVLCVEANPLMKPLLVSERAFVKMCAVSDKPDDNIDFHIHLDSLEAFSALKPIKSHPKYQAKARWGTVKVNVRTLDQILSEWSFPRLDALCVDVEGGEADVLRGIDLEKWAPRVVVVECWKEGELEKILSPMYERVWRSGDNDCYVRK
jgi:FkbM family methyltransferase